jgi:undecaprenyl-diphosphatase
VLIGWFLYTRRIDRIGSLLLLMAGQGVLQNGFKALFDRQRPEPLFNYVVGDTSSFPSGHALASICFFGILAYYLSNDVNSKWLALGIWLLAAAVILMVGLSRVYFDVHYPSDVAAGYFAGALWTASIATGPR